VSDVLRVVDAEYIGSPFSDYRLRLKLDGPSGENEFTLQILSDSGPGEHSDVFNKLRRAFDKDACDWPGQRLRLEMDGDSVVDAVPERQPDRVVKIAEADMVKVDGDEVLAARIVDTDGKPEGQLSIVIHSQDYNEEADGQQRLARLCAAVGLECNADTDSDELVGRVFNLTGKGDFKPVSVDLKKAA
jgi:hypothetical protein